MKTISEFKKETSEYITAIRALCKEELTAMRDDFCKNEFVNLLVPNRPTDEYSCVYNVISSVVKVNGGDSLYTVQAVRHYLDENEWTVIGFQEETKNCEEMCVEYMCVSDMIEIVSLLKRELFNY
jgi:hypothetical protein